MAERWHCKLCGEKFDQEDDAEEHLETPNHSLERIV